jgi:hypothetical protein
LKIDEADYFLQQIAASASDPRAMRYNTSAFLTAARSALHYALKEAQTRPRGRAWYDAAVGIDPTVAFLKDHRDINIHERPAPIRTHTTIEVAPATLAFSSTSAWMPPRREPLPSGGTVSYRYEFKGWTGSEDVATLCARYSAEIKRIVADGRSRGLLTAP